MLRAETRTGLVDAMSDTLTRRRARLTRRRLLGLGVGAVATLGAGALVGRNRPAPAALPFVSAEPWDRERFLELCLQTARANVKWEDWVVPGVAYGEECYLRDAYWTLGAMDDVDLASATFERFAATQMPTGQVPTSLHVPSGEVNHVRDDESSALFILLGLDLARAGSPADDGPLGRATGFLLERLEQSGGGGYATGPGPTSWWLDTFSLAYRDVVTYTQGIVAVALRAAAELGLAVPPTTIEGAEGAYRSLYRSDLGTLMLSAGTTLRDVSSLTGDYLSWRYFDRPLLGAEETARTLAGFRRVTFPDGALLGFRVATQINGAYMPVHWFEPTHENVAGQYHNGGSWLLWDALALAAGIRHGVPEAPALLEARLRAEVRTEWALHEYLATDPLSPYFGGVPDAWRSGYAWNAYVRRVVTGLPEG